MTFKLKEQQILLLSQTNEALKELLADRTEILKAIRYWKEKSPKRSKQYSDLAMDLERDILEYCSFNKT